MVFSRSLFFILLRYRSIVFVTVCLLGWNGTVLGQVEAILVSGSAETEPIVRIVLKGETFPTSISDETFLFFPPREEKPEQWAIFEKGISSPIELSDNRLHAPGNIHGTTAGGCDLIPSRIIPMEQLLAVTLNRSVSGPSKALPFSPGDGAKIINPCFSVRRLPDIDPTTDVKTFPGIVFRLFQDGQPLAEIRMDEGIETLKWSDIPDLPERLKPGLPPGEYALRSPDGIRSHRFTVKSVEFRQWIHRRHARIESLLGPDDPITVQIVVETLLQDAIDGPFPTDALDRLAEVKPERMTPYLKKIQADLRSFLTGEQGEDEKITRPADDPETLAESVRLLLSNEKWTLAAEKLDLLEKKLAEKSRTALPDRDDELVAICHLYRGMILAESGVSRFEEGGEHFYEALRLLSEQAEKATGPKGPSETLALSLFRTANNFGNFRLRLVQDRLYNQALAVAAGRETTITETLLFWAEALTLHRLALEISETSLTNRPELSATAKINMARLYALLGDMIHLLASEPGTEIEKGAFATAHRLVREVLETNPSDEEPLKGIAHHLLADMAYRQGNVETSRKKALSAREYYLRCGLLSGVEAVERLLGLLEMKDPSAGLKHLAISHELSEMLRERIPMDRIGLSRAGFFARRAYVNERMIDLLVQEGRPVEALAVLETGKGRALQDILLQAGLRDPLRAPNETRSTEEILADWPADIAALEYYIGSEKCHGFLILRGEITAFPLTDSSGVPLESQRLVVAVRTAVDRLKNGLAEMRNGDYSREWQESLYHLRVSLLPASVLESVRAANVSKLLIVPHHILHYLPFPALVVERDPHHGKGKEIPDPRYLLDESFDIFTAPSLQTWDLIRRKEIPPASDVTQFAISTFSSGGRPLLGVKEDVRNVRNAFGKSTVRLFLDEKATKKDFIDRLARQGILIVSTHGWNVPDASLESALLFRSETEENEELTAREIYESTVGAGLVVLNACQTGLAEQAPLPGDDLFGLQRAFLSAGAGAVVSSSWNTFDRTGPKIIGEMAKNLVSGADAVSALAEAQRHFLRNQRSASDAATNQWRHPYFWAPFTITGREKIFWQSP